MKIETLDEAIEAMERELQSDKKVIFDLGDGEKGRLCEIKYFSHTHGIDELVFKPVRNDYYYETRRKLGDDYVCCISDWTHLVYQLPEVETTS